MWVQASQFFNRLPTINEKQYKKFLKNGTFLRSDSLEIYLVVIEEVVPGMI